MGRSPFGYIRHDFEYPEYKHKNLDSRASLIASVNSRKGAFNNILNSKVILEDEKIMVSDILNRLDILREKIKENDNDKKPILSFKGTRTTFESF